MGEVTTIGLDLAKHVFQVHGVDAEGATVLRKQLRRAKHGRPDEERAAEVRALEVRPGEDCPAEVRPSEVRLFEVRLGEVRSGEGLEALLATLAEGHRPRGREGEGLARATAHDRGGTDQASIEASVRSRYHRHPPAGQEPPRARSEMVLNAPPEWAD